MKSRAARAGRVHPVRFIDSDSVQPTQAELTAHPLPRSLSRLNPDLLYGNVLASGVGVGTLTLLQSDSLDSCASVTAKAKPSSAPICR